MDKLKKLEMEKEEKLQNKSALSLAAIEKSDFDDDTLRGEKNTFICVCKELQRVEFHSSMGQPMRTFDQNTFKMLSPAFCYGVT